MTSTPFMILPVTGSVGLHNLLEFFFFRNSTPYYIVIGNSDNWCPNTALCVQIRCPAFSKEKLSDSSGSLILFEWSFLQPICVITSWSR